MRIIVAGSGNSITEGLNSGLRYALSNEFVLSTNYNYRFLPTTIPIFHDYLAYQFCSAFGNNITSNVINNIPNNDLHAFPVIICQFLEYFANEDWKRPSNFYYVKRTKTYNDNPWVKGFFKGHLSGTLATCIAFALGATEIYLLGIDHNDSNGNTHYYGQLQHPTPNITIGSQNFALNHGVGTQQINDRKHFNTTSYNNPANEYWKEFSKLPSSCQIYNVNPTSSVTLFPKITYDEFYNRLKVSNNAPSIFEVQQKLQNYIQTLTPGK